MVLVYQTTKVAVVIVEQASCSTVHRENVISFLPYADNPISRTLSSMYAEYIRITTLDEARRLFPGIDEKQGSVG